jgi:hypothetical protein
MVTQNEIWESLRLRNAYLIRHYFPHLLAEEMRDNHSMILGVAMSWLERASNEVPQMRIWLENEMATVEAENTPFDA